MEPKEMTPEKAERTMTVIDLSPKIEETIKKDALNTIIELRLLLGEGSVELPPVQIVAAHSELDLQSQGLYFAWLKDKSTVEVATDGLEVRLLLSVSRELAQKILTLVKEES